MHNHFSRFARAVESAAGSPWAFITGVVSILVWAAFGPMFGWSDTHQLIINTGTTIITFLMVFLIQNTQSRDTAALHLKLDELIRVTDARNELMLAEHLDEAAQRAAKQEFEGIAR